MNPAILRSRAVLGVQAPEVIVEVHLANGLPAFHIVGLPEKAVQESRERVRAAILNARYDFPARRITVNLAPAELPKEGGRFDLPIAIAILVASGQLPATHLDGLEFIGELGLTGTLRAVPGALPAAVAVRADARALVLPEANADEAALLSEARLLAADSLLRVCEQLQLQEPDWYATTTRPGPVTRTYPDLGDVRGQQQGKRALEIAAAGSHNLLLLGPPGGGKSMLAQRLPGLLPPLDDAQALSTATVYSVSGQRVDPDSWRVRPFRSPHHSASAVALVGGGSQPKPGEISLAHNGVLFLDELPEFQRQVLETLREPMETGSVNISRAARSAEFPADFQLVAAMNPCPCGHLGDARKVCRCTAEQVARYRNRISGPLLDRIDIQLEIPAVDPAQLMDTNPAHEESSDAVAARVAQAHRRQLQRQGCVNSRLQGDDLQEHAALDDHNRALLTRAMEQLGLSARGLHKVLRVARTIADLDDAAAITQVHLVEAIGYRRLQTGGN